MDLIAPQFASIGQSLPSLIANTGAFAKVILVILFVISIIAWAIMWDRTRLFLRLRTKGKVLMAALPKRGVAACIAELPRFTPSVEGAVLSEVKRFVELSPHKGTSGGILVHSAEEEVVERDKLRVVLDRRALGEISEMERHLVFLSTTSSVAPFLGLMGTVWGIMSSFLSMGMEGSASIEVVGPGIAEALLTTIAGLAAAIPALIGYNLLVRQVHRKETLLDLFISRVVEQVIRSAGSPDRGGVGEPSSARMQS